MSRNNQVGRRFWPPGYRAVRLAEAPRASASPPPSRWFEQHYRDDPLARPLLVHLVAVVIVIDQPP